MQLRGTMEIDKKGNLKIGKVDMAELANKYGTPLYVIDQQCIENKINNFQKWFKSDKLNTEIVYASKAFINSYICQVIAQKGLGIDAISEGDLHLLQKVKFPMDRVYLHGNAKSESELELALKLGVGRIVVDNFDEIARLRDICKNINKTAKIMIRVNPGVETHTHKYLRTALDSSKFGISMYKPELMTTIAELKDDSHLELCGIHCHIGSQINEEAAFVRTVEVMVQFCANVRDEIGLDLKEINFGGGFAIYYAKRDTPPDLSSLLPAIVAKVEEQVAKNNLGLQKIVIEPGRAVIGEAGTTLYKIEAQKTTYSGRKYVMVDGGMADNPRPALYSALYEATVINKGNVDSSERVAIAGKCCESGDIIIEDIMLPPTEIGEIIAIAATGAYNYSMASNYNGLTKPAVVFVKDGKEVLVTRRQLPEELHGWDTEVPII